MVSKLGLGPVVVGVQDWEHKDSPAEQQQEQAEEDEGDALSGVRVLQGSRPQRRAG